MIEYGLPDFVTVDGKNYEIEEHGDFRQILAVIAAMNDKELSQYDRLVLSLRLFYGKELPADLGEAFKQMSIFINTVENDAVREKDEESPSLMDWEKDFPLIISAMQKTLGTDPRAMEYMHWWSFVSAYLEIGESTFSFVIGIRQKIAKGKKLDANEKEFFAKNKDVVLLKDDYDDEWLNEDF